MERMLYKNAEGAQQVNHYDYKLKKFGHQEYCRGDYDVRSNKSEKEVQSSKIKNKLKYTIDPSSDDCSSGYELEMEDTIVNLNDEILKLNEELEIKKTNINVLQDELVNNRSSFNEMKTSLQKLQIELDEKNDTIRGLTEELMKKSILLNEAEDIGYRLNESLNKIAFLEESIKEKNEALELNGKLLKTVKTELDQECQNAFMREKELSQKEHELRLSFDKEIHIIKEQYTQNLKEICGNSALKEKFLEKQIEMLFKRIEELTERSESHQQEYETVKKVYQEEYNEMKSKVDEISKSSGSHISDLNNRLAASLSNEVSLKVQLKSKIDEEKRINQELNSLKVRNEELLINERNLCKRLKQTEIQVNLLKEEKEELNKQLVISKNKYEELNNNYNRERKEKMKEQKEIFHSYENDLHNLVKALEDLHHSIKNMFSNCNEELCNTESEEDSIIRLPVVSKESFSNQSFYSAMKIVCQSLTETINLRKELKHLIQDYHNVRVAFDARKKMCDDTAQQMASLQSEIMTLEKEKECAENNLKYIEEQNARLKYDHLKKQCEVDEINNELLRYKEETDRLNTELKKVKEELTKLSQIQSQQQSETYIQLTNVDLSPIASENRMLTKFRKEEDITDEQSSYPVPSKMMAQLATSTPHPRSNWDLQGGGEFLKPKASNRKSEVHLSLVKWMEKCHELDKENIRLNGEVENLTIQLQDLKFNSQFLKDEMNAYEDIRNKLEQKLSNHLALKQQYAELQDEFKKSNSEIKSLNKEIDYLKNENQELTRINLQMEEKYGKYLVELTENKNLTNNAINSESVINNFNEKVQEIIALKGEIRLLLEDKKNLSRRVDLLLEANNIYSSKVEENFSELLCCKNELEKMRNEKLDVCSENRLLNKEIQLLQLRLDYLSALRDNHRCSSGSIGQNEDLIQELIMFVRSVMENKLDNSSTEINEDQDGNKTNTFNLPEILKNLSHQLNEEKLDFEGKLKELQHIINLGKNDGVISDEWVLQLDKKLRIIIEELKFHKEQYNRIEEALRSTGKFHDELQKQKDLLRVKDHEISSVQKKMNEEKLQAKKFACHVKYLQQELDEKNDIIKANVDQKSTLEKELKELQCKLSEAEKKYEKDIKAAEWKLQQAKLQNIENEVERKLITTHKNEKWQTTDLGSESWERVREEVERVYQTALRQVQHYFNTEVSSNVLQVQEEHKEQIAEFQRIVDEQAIKIGMLLKKNSVEDGCTTDSTYINEEYKKQFELATYALQQLHHEEMQLMKLQLEAEKHHEIYKAIYENQQNVLKEDIHLKSNEDTFIDKNLLRKLESALLEDFLFRLQNFIGNWHSSYKNEVAALHNKLKGGIDHYMIEDLEDETLKKIENENRVLLNQYSNVINMAKDFLSGLETEYDSILKNLNQFVQLFRDKTRESFEEIKSKHLETAKISSLYEELVQTKKEKEELEKLHKNAIELLNADHKSEQDKIQTLLTEIKQCFESGCDPNALLKLRTDLEERHRKELEDLRTYFEEKCANLGKQYSDDVNSLHSRMLSLSSSCSDEIMSDHIGFDRGGAGDANFTYSDIEVENGGAIDKLLTPEQYKLIEELNFKWSENVKEMKRELEKKYSKKIEQLQEKLATFMYNNELDITVRCIQEDVMRDCKIEIEEIKKDIALRMLTSSADYSEGCNVQCDESQEQLKAALLQRDAAREQIVEVLGDSLSQDTINKITIEIIGDALSKCNLQEKIFSQVANLLTHMEGKLSLIDDKLKGKESHLLNLQTKMNAISQQYPDSLNKLKNYDEINEKIKMLQDAQLLDEFIGGSLEKDSMPNEIIQIKNIFQNSYEKKLAQEKEKQNLELEKIEKSYEEKERQQHNRNSHLMEKLMKGDFDENDWPPEIVQIKNLLQEMFEKKMIEEKEKNNLALEHLKKLHEDKEPVKDICRHSEIDLDQIIKERDNLKEMTVTLKSAVGQLVSYLNTCEDELNKTVVEELLKVYVETPKKSNSDYESLEFSPEFKKVHFAPEVGISDLDSSSDISSFLRLQLDSCLSKLKLEAASLLGLSALQPPPANLNKQIENLRKENEELLQEVADLKLRLDKHQNDSLELRDQFACDSQRDSSFTFLQDKAQQFLNRSPNIPPEAVRILEDLAKLGDSIIHELHKEKLDLQQQIDAADKQLKSTRQFLEEQAAERETERDDYSKEITNLLAQLKEKGKNLSFHERFTTEVSEPLPQKLGKISLSVEELEQQLKESNMLLEESEKKKGAVEAELKDAIDKIWVLRDIISDLESQLTSKSEKEALLEQKLDELETELDQQNGTQYAMAQELESLRSQSIDEGYLEQIKQLEEDIKLQFNSSVVRQLKSQIRDLEKTLDHRTRELETVYINNSNTSLSSPSEEVSVREQLEWNRSRTPEQCPSPVALPVEEVSKLQDKFLRHMRAEEMLIKRLRDQQLIAVKFQVELEEMHAEREALQKQMKKQMVLMAEANNKIDDLRHKVETAQSSANKDLISQIQELKEKYSKAEQALDSTHNQLMEHKIQLAHAEEIISKQKIEISNLAHCDHEIVDSLRLELAAVTAERNKLEDLLDKYRRDFNLDMVNALLVDKNEDIDHLQHTVNQLQSQKEDEDKQGSCNSKGYRVSFASNIEHSSSLPEDMRLRDAAHMQSLELYPDNNFMVFGGSISPIPHDNEEKPFCTSLKSFNFSEESVLSKTDNEAQDVEQLLGDLRSELKDKNEIIGSLEKEIEYLKSIEEDLKNTKSELEAVVSSVSEDKKYYENELHFMSEKLSKKEEEIKRLTNTVRHKDEEVLKTTADVQSLREISLSLQEKLREAKELAVKENVQLLKEDLANLNEELLSKEKEISELENELQLFKSDYNDEKELCEALKSSLNTITAEKQDLEENIDSLKRENRKLMNDVQLAEDRLNQYVIAVRNLKNELSSRSNALESNNVPSNTNVGFIENEIKTLQDEVVKLIELNENLFEERNTILEELNKLKMAVSCEEYASKDSLISELQGELNELRKAVHSVKEEKLEAFANFSKEICQLHKDIDSLQDTKQQIMQKWKEEYLEKQALQKKLEAVEEELDAEKCHNEEGLLAELAKNRKLSLRHLENLDIPPVSDSAATKSNKLVLCRSGMIDIQPMSLSSKLQKLSVDRIYVADFQPVSELPVGIDALADKMRQETKLSASLDNSLLESFLPDSSEGYQASSEPTESAAVGGGRCITITGRLRSLEAALLNEMEKAREFRNVLRDKENKCRALEAERNEMTLHMEKLGRVLASHEEKLSLLSNQLKSEKDKVITLELMVAKEKSSLKQVSNLLDEERNKARESQKEDIALMETMRKRLKSLMENEAILKQMVRNERHKSNQLVAQLNSLQALEKYHSDSEGENHKKCQKSLLDEREKFLRIKVEWEKERRTCEDLREVLARERTALCYLQDNLAKSEKHRQQVEKEVSSLQRKLNEEIVRREMADRRAIDYQGMEVENFQKQMEAIESRNKKSLETAYAVIKELEQEYNDLKIYVRSQQDQDERWKDQIHLPLIQQLNEVNDNLEALIKERVELKRTIERLNEENNRLQGLVEELRRVRSPASERLSLATTDLQVPNVRLQGVPDVVTPIVEREIDELLDRVLQAEKHKKALVFQKRYLLVALRGHQEAHTETLHRLRLQHHRHWTPPRKFNFRSVVLAVIATFKIRGLPIKRRGAYYRRKELLLTTIKRSLSRSTAEVERLTTAQTSSRRIAPHSPPSRDRANLRFR